jgi:hypothetical protein
MTARKQPWWKDVRAETEEEMRLLMRLRRMSTEQKCQLLAIWDIRNRTGRWPRKRRR